MKLGRFQKSLLTGMILGDGFLQKTGKKNARLRLEHSQKQEAYLKWKVAKLPKLFPGKITRLERVHPVTKETYYYVRAQSNATPELGKLKAIFYPDGKKKIPETLRDMLKSPLSLAVWYMDDGYYYERDKCAYLYLGNVSREEADVVKATLQENFGLATRVKQKKKGHAIYFPPDEAKKLKNVIQPCVIQEMKYKLPPDPVTTEDLHGLRWERKLSAHHTPSPAKNERDEDIV